MSNYHYNNIAVISLAICATLNHSRRLTLSKACLIAPIVSHQDLLAYLARKTTDIQSVEKLVIEKTSCFSNFNKRYIDALPTSVNAIQLLSETAFVYVEEEVIHAVKMVPYSKSMGFRAEKIYQASLNISNLLNNNPENLYLNLRVEL